MNESLIDHWVQKKIITKAQGEKIRQDVTEYKKDKVSHRSILFISTIGAVLLGLSGLLFIGSNWEHLSPFAKASLGIGATLAMFVTGYLLAYVKKGFPRTGYALIFLSAILFGGSLALLTQIYHSGGPAHKLILAWIVGALPIIYSFRSNATAVLASFLFIIWGFLFFSGSHIVNWEILEILDNAGIKILLLGISLFTIGSLHYFKENLSGIARSYRLTAMKLIFFMLFLLTFKDFHQAIAYEVTRAARNESYDALAALRGPLVLIITSLIGMLIYYFKAPRPETHKRSETLSVVGILAVTAAFLLFPGEWYYLIYNVLFAVILITLLLEGQRREDMKSVNKALFWIVILIIARYIDTFYGYFEPTISFLIGGTLLLTGGIFLESKRKEIKSHMKSHS